MTASSALITTPGRSLAPTSADWPRSLMHSAGTLYDEGALVWSHDSTISRRQKAPSLPGCRGVQTHRFPITVALVRQPVDEPGVDGRRPRRPRPADRFSRHHRSDG